MNPGAAIARIFNELAGAGGLVHCPKIRATAHFPWRRGRWLSPRSVTGAESNQLHLCSCAR